MTFTYDLTSGFTDLARVRFHVGDTDADAVIFSDEEIAAYIVEFDDWQGATREALGSLIRTLSRTPNFQADWLKVDVSSAIARFENALAKFEARYGDALSVEAEAVHVYRADSHATSVTYDGT